MEDLETWCRLQGMETHRGVEVCTKFPWPFSRGLVTAREIKPNSSGEVELLRIPTSILMTETKAEICPPITQVLANPDLRLKFHEDDLLAIFLLIERSKSDSRWNHYINILPTEFHNLLYWTEEELQELCGSNIFTIATQLRVQVIQDHVTLQPVFDSILSSLSLPQDVFSLENYQWALSIIWSRALHLEVEGKRQKVLVPFLDLLNHSPLANERHYVDRDSVVVAVRDEYQIGMQVFINYGPFPNHCLLRLYGCVIEENPFDSVDLYVPMHPLAPMYDVKSAILERHGVNHHEDPFKLSLGELNQNLLATLRIQRMDENEVEFADRAFNGQILSIQNEIMVLNSLEEGLTSMLRGYSSTRAGDEALLKLHALGRTRTSLSRNMIMAIILRMGEKKILEDNITRIRSARERLIPNQEEKTISDNCDTKIDDPKDID